MSRDNQGLQIGLIISAILTIILGTTTFLGFRWLADQKVVAEEATKTASAAKQETNAAKQEAAAYREICFGLGDSQPQSPDDCKTQMKQELAQYLSSNPSLGNYRAAFMEAGKLLQQKSNDYTQAMAMIAKRDGEYRDAIASVEQNVQNEKDNAKQARDDQQQDAAKYDAMSKDATQQNTALTARITTDQKTATDKVKQLEGEKATVQSDADRNRRLAQRRQEQLQQMTDPTFQTAQGRIEYVSQDKNMVWISLGSEDHLPRLTTFAVYDADASDVSNAPRKGSIEITNILGPHMAQGNILDGKLTNPIIVGDLIQTPLWTPGVQKRFVMTGLIDLDGDGKDDRAALKAIIEATDGIVDNEVTEQTAIVIMGNRPDEKSTATDIQDYTEIKTAAERFLVTMVSLDDFLLRTGYQPGTKLYRVGTGSGVDPWKPLERVGQKAPSSSGTVAPIYQEPGRKAPSSSGTVAPIYQDRQAPAPEELTSF